MLESVLKFFGLWVSGNEKLVGVRPEAYATVHPALLIGLGVLLAAGVGWLYRREQGELTLARRITAAVCRILLVGIVLLILARPVLAITTSASMSDTLAVLIDTSSSMQIADVRDQAADQARAAIALDAIDPKGGLQQPLPPAPPATAPSRMELVKAAWQNPRLQLPQQLRKNFQLSIYTFDRQLSDLSSAAAARPDDGIAALEAKGSATALGDAIQRVLVAKRGENLGGILIISDGASNTGLSLAAAAKLARDEEVPLYVYGVGITAPRDVAVSAMLAPDVAFAGNELPIMVRMRVQGYDGRRANLVLKLDGNQVAAAEVPLDAGERTVALTLTPQKVGSFTLSASIEPLPGEVVTDNNVSPPKHLRVVDTRIKVLHIEQSPRWEFKYLQAMLMRDPRVEYHCWLMDADPSAASGTAASEMIAAFPASADLQKFDLVILGDVEPRRLPAGALEQLNAFVADSGGGFIMMAGPRASPLGYRRTPIERMLPVEFDASSLIPLTGEGEKPIQLELTPAGAANPMLHLAEKDADNVRRWASLAPLYWTARVAGPKPAAEVLAVDPDPAKATRLGKMPVIALQQYGAGSVLYVGTDNTWRWRRNNDLEVFDRLWSQIVEHMAMTHLLGAGGSTQLSLDRVMYAPGDRAVVFARLSRPGDLEPLIQPRLDAYFSRVGQPGDRQAVQLVALPDQPGVYRGEFLVPAQGSYQVKMDLAPQGGGRRSIFFPPTPKSNMVRRR